jgi:molybdenum cofactor cytidylyltransferase
VVRAQDAAKSVATLALDDIGVVTDIDTVDDLARAEALLAMR